LRVRCVGQPNGRLTPPGGRVVLIRHVARERTPPPSPVIATESAIACASAVMNTANTRSRATRMMPFEACPDRSIPIGSPRNVVPPPARRQTAARGPIALIMAVPRTRAAAPRQHRPPSLRLSDALPAARLI
jgi:hypothetical protein